MDNLRFVCLDTETTGLRVSEGARIVEIGMVEILSSCITGRQFQSYLKCDAPLSDVVKNITKITDEMLINKPSFIEISSQIIDFISKDINGNANKAILVIHNAKFDLSFLNFQLQESCQIDIKNYQVIDTINLIRNHIPGAKLSLNAICQRYNIDLSKREECGHSALLDSQILAQVFLKLISDGANIFEILNDKKIDITIHKRNDKLQSRNIYNLNQNECEKHDKMLSKIFSDNW